MKQEKQTELLRTQQMLNEVNRKLLMTLGVAEVFPGKWELAEHMVWFYARPSDDPAGWEIFHNDSFPVSIARVYQGIYKEDRLRVIEACRGVLKGKVKKVVVELRNIGPVAGVVAWVRGERFGVSFDEEIDPKLARQQVGGGMKEAPVYARAAVSAPKYDGWHGKVRRI